MIDREHDLAITRQAEVLKISRCSVYYLPRPVSSADLAITHATFDAIKVFDAMLQIGVSCSSGTSRRNPEHPRCREGIDSPSYPPGHFISEAMTSR